MDTQQITLSRLMRKKGNRLFKFPFPGKSDNGIWRLLVIYTEERLGAKVRNERTEQIQFCSASEVVIPLKNKQGGKEKKDKALNLPRTVPIFAYLSRPISQWVYFFVVVLLCLFIYLYALIRFL